MNSPILIVSDLDGTLLGDDDALARFARWHAKLRDKVLLVYASGRLVESVRTAIAETELPQPVAIIGGVGTEICWLPKYQSPPDWPRVRTPGWSRPAVLEALSGVRKLSLQEEQYQSPWKVSYYYRGANATHLDGLSARLREANLEAEIVYSSNRDLDILPKGVDKGSAARFVAKRLRIPPRRIIGCGDSGNDASLLRTSGYGVVVGNAQEELRRLAHSRTYQAEAQCAAGVLEGIQYWLPRLVVDLGASPRVRIRRL